MTTQRRRAGGHPFGPSHPVHLRARLRQAEVFRLRQAGFTLAQCAEAVGYSGPQGAHEALRSLQARANLDRAEQIEAVVLDCARLEKLLLATMPGALAGRGSHIEVALRLIGQRQELIEILGTLRCRQCA